MRLLWLLAPLLSTQLTYAQAPLHFDLVDWTTEPLIKQGDPGTQDIRCGFEGGCVIKQGGTYHYFPSERIGPNCTDLTRIGYWQSTDGLRWNRVRTLYQSTGDHTGTDSRATLFAAMPTYDEAAKRWNVFYVSYYYKLKPDWGYTHRWGHIYRGVSTVKGPQGIGGPYKDVGVIMQPDALTQRWEGHQGVDSFFAYPVGNKWLGFYGSAKTDVMPETPCQYWAIGLAEASTLAGPWKRLEKGNPIEFGKTMIENPIVTRIGNYYVACFDALNAENGIDDEAFALMYSEDGYDWKFLQYLPFDKKESWWWREMRTPLSFIDEGNGMYSLYFTAYKNYRGFAPMGRMRIRLAKQHGG
jgi:hypothetical protein